MIKKFVISTFEFTPHIGGLTVLHKLCHLLNENGYDAYLAPSNGFGISHADLNLPFELSPRYNTKLITEDIVKNIDETIVIYPETWFGNYLNAKNVVRWILAPPMPDRVITWNQNDLWFWYSKLYNSTALNYGGYFRDMDNTLYVGEFYSDIFKNNKVERDVNSWTLRKALGRISDKHFIHEPDSVFISYEDAGRFEWLSDIFNKSKRFYSYDPYTFLNVQAAMCGAESVVVPIPNLSLNEFLKHGMFSKYVAYGINDIPRAKETCIELQADILSIEKNTIDELHTFVEKCNKYFG